MGGALAVSVIPRPHTICTYNVPSWFIDDKSATLLHFRGTKEHITAIARPYIAHVMHVTHCKEQKIHLTCAVNEPTQLNSAKKKYIPVYCCIFRVKVRSVTTTIQRVTKVDPQSLRVRWHKNRTVRHMGQNIDRVWEYHFWAVADQRHSIPVARGVVCMSDLVKHFVCLRCTRASQSLLAD